MKVFLLAPEGVGEVAESGGAQNTNYVENSILCCDKLCRSGILLGLYGASLSVPF